MHFSVTVSAFALTTGRILWLTTADNNRTAFYFPMLAIITLFVYILKYPRLVTVESDIALLDIGAGHFGQIHCLTSGHVSFQFPREVSVLANRAVRRAAAKVADDETAGTIFHASADAPHELNDAVVSLHFPQPIITITSWLTSRSCWMRTSALISGVPCPPTFSMTFPLKAT